MKNNKGLSLVELIIAFALLAIVGLAANGLLASGSNLFKSNAQEIDLQEETQSAFNHLNNLIVDTQRGINFNDVADGKLLQIYNNYMVYHIKWKSADQCIYYAEQPITDPESPVGSETLLISDVEDFNVNLNDVETKGKVQISIKLADNGKSYEGTQIYSLRNDIKKDVTLDQVRQEVAIDLGSFVETVTISTANKYCAKGRDYQFSASVSGTGYPISSVTWSLAGNTSGGTRIDDRTGLLEIAEDENALELEITATSVGLTRENSTVSDSVTVKIVDLIGIRADYNQANAMVGKILMVYGTPLVQNSNLVEGDIFQVDFRLPTAADVEADAAKPINEQNGLRVYNGIEVYKSSSTANACSLFLTTAMEADEYVAECFARDGQVPIKLIMTSALDNSKEFIATINVKPSDFTGLEIGGNLTVNRGGTTALSAKVDAQGIDSRDVTTTWSITKDAGLGQKVSIDSKTGVLTVSKDIDFKREFLIEVTATAKAKDSSKEMKTTISILIPKVTISLPLENCSVKKGASERFAFQVNGLVVEAGDVICSSKPSMKNTLLYCTAKECVISVGARETKEQSSVSIMLKDDTSITSTIILYVLSEETLYNVEGRKGVYAEYFAPAAVGGGKEVKLDNNTKLVYSVENNKTVLTVGSTKYDYDEGFVKKGVTGWWIPRSNVEGKDYYIPVPGLSPELPDEITTSYKLNYNGLLLTYAYDNGDTYVQVLNEDNTTEYFVLTTKESWITAK